MHETPNRLASASTESQNPALTGRRHRSVVGRPAEPEIEPRPTRGGPILHWVHIVRFIWALWGPERTATGLRKSQKSSLKFWREDFGHLIIRPDI